MAVTAPVEPAPTSNTPFAILWALLVPVLTGGVMLVGPVGIADWTDVQTAAVVALVNAASALVLAIVATKWADTTEEPVAVQNSLAAFLLALFATSAVFQWWAITKDAESLVIAWFSALLYLMAYAVRRVVFAPKGVVHAVSSAHVQGMGAATRKLSDGSDLPGAPGA